MDDFVIGRPMYVAQKGVRAGTGIAIYCRGRVDVVAPDDYIGPFLADHRSGAGYAHCFLKPFQVTTGVLKSTNKPQPDTSLRTVAYVLVEERKPNGLLCAGAISLSRSSSTDYTFCFFPAMQRLARSEREIDHLTAHIRFQDGKVIADQLWARVRREFESNALGKVSLKGLRRDDYHFAFEYWVKDIDYLDPAGSIVSSIKSPWNGKSEEKTIHRLIDRIKPFTFGCSLPTEDGRGPIGLPILARVGIVMDTGIARAGGLDKALSQPKGASRPSLTRIHSYLNLSKLSPGWPSDARVFIEIGELTRIPKNDYVLPDISDREVKGLDGVNACPEPI